VKLRDFGLLTDENIDPAVVLSLRNTGFDVWDVCENYCQGSTDVDLLRRSFRDTRIVVTHDADFGTLTILGGEPVVGIVYLRPGHIDPQFTIDTLEAVFRADPEVTPPFLVVAKRTGTTVTLRIRSLAP
jgi:predicted nuclease of predicted toxin-antitoxin system